MIHFHSNNYASFRGYEIEVEYPNSISDWDAQSYADSSMTITWQDNASEATEWTITYFCDEDSLMTATSNTKSVTLTGLRNDTYYGYYIKNIKGRFYGVRKSQRAWRLRKDQQSGYEI